jgi:hypothetical protein
MLLVAYQYVLRLWLRRERDQWKRPSKERMAWVDHLDQSLGFFDWVVEGGIKLCGRSTGSTMTC